MDLKRVYVRNISAHRILRQKRIDYKARGRAGLRTKDFCIIHVDLYEISEKELCRRMVLGETPTMFSHLL